MNYKGGTDKNKENKKRRLINGFILLDAKSFPRLKSLDKTVRLDRNG